MVDAGEFNFSLSPGAILATSAGSQPPGSQELAMRTNLASILRGPLASASQVPGFPGRPHQALLFSSVGDDT